MSVVALAITVFSTSFPSSVSLAGSSFNVADGFSASFSSVFATFSTFLLLRDPLGLLYFEQQPLGGFNANGEAGVPGESLPNAEIGGKLSSLAGASTLIVRTSGICPFCLSL